jgi:potassium channel subfamily K
MSDSIVSQSRTVTPEDPVAGDIQDKAQDDVELEMGSDLGEDKKQFYEPAHIWYATTVFPLSAACFGPMASAFNVCALVEDWRVFIPAGGTEAQEIAISDPAWYDFLTTVISVIDAV